jgi:hypothetical protein
MHALRKTIWLGGWQHWLWALVLLPTCRSTPRDRQHVDWSFFTRVQGRLLSPGVPFFTGPGASVMPRQRGFTLHPRSTCGVPRRLRGPAYQGPVWEGVPTTCRC